MTTATALPQGDDQLVPFPPAPTPSITSEEFGHWLALADEKERVQEEAELCQKRLAVLRARWRQLDTEQSSLASIGMGE